MEYLGHEEKKQLATSFLREGFRNKIALQEKNTELLVGHSYKISFIKIN